MQIDRTVYPDNHENFRGMVQTPTTSSESPRTSTRLDFRRLMGHCGSFQVDVYGQLSPLYATQKGGQMEPTGKMIKRLIGIPI